MSIENPTPSPWSKEAHDARVAAQNAPRNVMEAYGNQPADVDVDDMKQVYGAGEAIAAPDVAVERAPEEVETARELGATSFEAQALALGEESDIDENGRTKFSLAELKAMRAAQGDAEVPYHAKQQDKPPLTREQLDAISDNMPKAVSLEDQHNPDTFAPAAGRTYRRTTPRITEITGN